MADLRIVTLTGADAALGESVVEDFRRRLRGRLLPPGDAEYGQTRLIWNGLIGEAAETLREIARKAEKLPLLPSQTLPGSQKTT